MVRGNVGGLGVGAASCEAERDEKKVDGARDAEGDVDELKVQLN